MTVEDSPEPATTVGSSAGGGVRAGRAARPGAVRAPQDGLRWRLSDDEPAG